MSIYKITVLVLGLACAELLASCDGAVKYGSNVVKWKANDQVLMVNNGGVFKPDYVAIFPAVNAEGVANVIDGYEATFYLPSTQVYSENSYAEVSMPKVAYSMGEELQFKYVLGGLCLPMVGDSLRVTKVVLTSANADEALWGTCKTNVSTTGDDPTSTITNDELGRNAITLDCGDGVVLNDTIVTIFCLAVPIGSLESGFTIDVYDGDKNIFEKSTTKAPGSGFIQRSVVRRMNEVLCL